MSAKAPFRPLSPGAGAGSAALLAGLLLLDGCASVPQAGAPRLAKAAETYETARTFDAPQRDWPADGWWKAYNDPQLDALMAEALRDSPTLAEAQARITRARASRAEAVAALLPAISANGSIEDEKQSYRYLFPSQFLPRGYQDYGQMTLNLTWELDFWGKNRAAVAAAASEARAAAADAAEARLVLTTDIAEQYATLGRLLGDREVAVQAERVREETAGLAAQRVSNGLDTRAELEQAKAGPPAARANIAALDEQIAQARDALAALAGAGPDRGLAITPGKPPHVSAFGLPANLKIDLIGRRPDIVAARWRAEAADRRVREARAAFYPNVDVSAFFGQQALHLENLVDKGAAFGAVGPALSLPIFQGGRLRAQFRGAGADRDAAVAAYDAAVTEALKEVADVAASERALAERLAQSREALAHDEEAYRVARLRYEGGLSTYQSVLLAEDAVLTQRQLVSDLEGRAFTLDVALVRALGGGFSSNKEAPHA